MGTLKTASEVVVGEQYLATISGRRVIVQIVGQRESIGRRIPTHKRRKFGPVFTKGSMIWDAKNLETGRVVVIRSARKLTPYRALVALTVDTEPLLSMVITKVDRDDYQCDCGARAEYVLQNADREVRHAVCGVHLQEVVSQYL